jgi:hypothetical protein
LARSLIARRDNLTVTIAALDERFAQAEGLPNTPIGAMAKLLLPA